MSLGLSDIARQMTGARSLGKGERPLEDCRSELLSVLRFSLQTGVEEEAEVRKELSLSMAARAPGERQWEPSCLRHLTQG